MIKSGTPRGFCALSFGTDCFQFLGLSSGFKATGEKHFDDDKESRVFQNFLVLDRTARLCVTSKGVTDKAHFLLKPTIAASASPVHLHWYDVINAVQVVEQHNLYIV